MGQNLINITDSTFASEVLESTVPVLVDFWATWCGPCKMVAPILEDIAEELQGKLKVVKLNIDENQQAAVQYGVRSIPTLLLFKNGSVLATKIGALPKAALRKWIESNL